MFFFKISSFFSRNSPPASIMDTLYLSENFLSEKAEFITALTVAISVKKGDQ